MTCNDNLLKFMVHSAHYLFEEASPVNGEGEGDGSAMKTHAKLRAGRVTDDALFPEACNVSIADMDAI